MRIIAGTRKGFKLGSVKGRQVRPTQDRVREALFNILEQDGPFTNVADLFAGTGAHIVIIAGFLVSLLFTTPLSLGDAVRRVPDRWSACTPCTIRTCRISRSS